MAFIIEIDFVWPRLQQHMRSAWNILSDDRFYRKWGYQRQQLDEDKELQNGENEFESPPYSASQTCVSKAA